MCDQRTMMYPQQQCWSLMQQQQQPPQARPYHLHPLQAQPPPPPQMAPMGSMYGMQWHGYHVPPSQPLQRRQSLRRGPSAMETGETPAAAPLAFPPAHLLAPYPIEYQQLIVEYYRELRRQYPEVYQQYYDHYMTYYAPQYEAQYQPPYTLPFTSQPSRADALGPQRQQQQQQPQGSIWLVPQLHRLPTGQDWRRGHQGPSR